MSHAPHAGWKPGEPIPYVRQEIPKFDVPSYEGERYSVLAPDTLDLQERDHYRENSTRWRKMERFVFEQSVVW